MAPPIALIVGLGNPGREYETTRHNAGFWFVDAIARQTGASFKAENKFHGEAVKTRVHGHEVWLLKPSTFMNRSGLAVCALAKFYKIAPESILIAHDELDFDPGDVRLKTGGGHGGHNGLRDSIAALGSKNFARLRIGIGHPGDARQVSNYVLKKAGADDQRAIEDAIERGLDVLPLLVDGEMEKAMHRLHSR